VLQKPAKASLLKKEARESEAKDEKNVDAVFFFQKYRMQHSR
jgi:hypothetical protein